MTCDIFIRSYAGDFEWLTYCLRSIHRFASGFRRVIVVVPNGQRPPTGALETVYHIHESCDGYLHQQITKLNADAFTDADNILFMDSDTIFTRPITPADAINNEGLVKWLYTPYASLGQDNSEVWKRVTAKAMKREVDNEFMRRHPLCAPRWALEGLRGWFWRAHGMSLDTYVADQPGREFSEWNVLGAWLWFHHRDRIEWINTDENMGVPFVKQAFSWGGMSDEIRREMEGALV